MSKSEVYMFPDGYGRTAGANSNIDPALLLLLNNNGGFGGGNFMWVLFLFFLWPLFRNGNMFGGNGMFGGGGNPCDCTGFVSNLANNQTGRELLAQAIQGNRDAISNLSNMLGCQVGDIQNVLSQIMSKVGDISCQTQLSSQQVINAIQAGNCQLGSQLASCCCDLKGAIKDVAIGTERGFASLAYENAQGRCEIKQAISEATQRIVDGQTAAEKRELQNTINALREKNSQQAIVINNAQQTAAFGQMIAQATTPIAQAVAGLQGDIAGIKCKLPETVTLPFSCATAVPTNYLYGVAGFGLNGCGQIWG